MEKAKAAGAESKAKAAALAEEEAKIAEAAEVEAAANLEKIESTTKVADIAVDDGFDIDDI